jgi:energy-coupling factor transport system substrate-specific component
MEVEFLKELLGGGPLNTLFVGLALVGMVIAAIIWILEFSGRTITLKGIKPNNMTWNAQAIALIAVSAAIYIAGRPLQLQFIPGIGGFNPSLALAPVLACLFGLPGAIGVTFSMPIGDAISGSLTLGSVAGFLSHTFVTWLVYKNVKDPSMRNARSIGTFYLWGIIIGPIIHAIIIPGWLDFTNVLPPAVAWGGVTVAILLNHMVIAAIVAPILLYVLYPRVKQAGLFHGDRAVSRRIERGEPLRSAPD